ncbi:Uncharacterized protein HZ326_20518 [Fusarium oxysporum f. sp. albedinis]|nr:Choline transport protein [Fusarium oxysporum f. sp. albedinis]KAJ0136456.1 Uncharacterized protein HZ326_20518 [Fusarium oxysporum f. sp. albedinis]
MAEHSEATESSKSDDDSQQSTGNTWESHSHSRTSSIKSRIRIRIFAAVLQTLNCLLLLLMVCPTLTVSARAQQSPGDTFALTNKKHLLQYVKRDATFSRHTLSYHVTLSNRQETCTQILYFMSQADNGQSAFIRAFSQAIERREVDSWTSFGDLAVIRTPVNQCMDDCVGF